MALSPERIEERLRERFPGVAITRATAPSMPDPTWIVPAASLIEVCTFLRDDPELDFAMLSFVAGVDYLPRAPRFETVYNLLSLTQATRVTLKVELTEENPRVPTVSTIWPTANWHERETYDFYGIEFTGHPDLTRILLPEDWQGWPLRKDSPLGYEEVAFTHNTPDRQKPDPKLKKLAPKKVKYRAQ
jgi:NADH-quinone oxidoreductase subunit C